jgi:hypothetical protein
MIIDMMIIHIAKIEHSRKEALARADRFERLYAKANADLAKAESILLERDCPGCVAREAAIESAHDMINVYSKAYEIANARAERVDTHLARVKANMRGDRHPARKLKRAQKAIARMQHVIDSQSARIAELEEEKKVPQMSPDTISRPL